MIYDDPQVSLKSRLQRKLATWLATWLNKLSYQLDRYAPGGFERGVWHAADLRREAIIAQDAKMRRLAQNAVYLRLLKGKQWEILRAALNVEDATKMMRQMGQEIPDGAA